MKLILTMSLLVIPYFSFSQQTLKITSELRNVPTWKVTQSDRTTPVWSFHGSNVSSDTFPNVTADYYLSSWTGNDGNDGLTKLTPKRTLKSMDTLINASTLGTPYIGIEGGSVFEGSEGDGIALNRGNVSVVVYNRGEAGKYNYPVLKGMQTYNTGWIATGGGGYYQDIPNTVALNIGFYSWMYVMEVDTLLEHTAPYTAINYLHSAASAAAVDTTLGSYFCTVSGPPSSPNRIYIHTTNGASPNNHSINRYEVVTRDVAVNRNFAGTYGQTLNVRNLFALNWGAGAGPLSSRQDTFRVARSIVMGNAIHMGGAGNASTVDSCAFIAGDENIDGTSFVFYKTEGANEVNTIQNSTFLDSRSILYTHTGGGGVHHGRMNYYNNYSYNTAFYVVSSDGDNDTTFANYCYSKDANYFFWGTLSPISYIYNTVAENCNTLINSSTNAYVNNTLYRSKHLPSQAVNMTYNNKINITNSIFHVKTDSVLTGNTGGYIINNPDSSMRVWAKYNIFISQVPTGKYCFFSNANNYAGMGQSRDTFDFNVYIIVSGSPYWGVQDGSTGDPNIFSFATWKTRSGQDQNSIFIDLRTGYPDGLNTIFVDPDNGNYNLTNTAEADAIRAVGAGMTSTISSWVDTPTREQVIYNVQHGIFTPVSSLLQ